MIECVFVRGSVKDGIEAELKSYRKNHGQYVGECRPQVFFVPLGALMDEPHYATLISQPFFHKACSLLARKQRIYESCLPFDPANG